MLNFPSYEEVPLASPPLKEVVCQVRFPPILRIATDARVAREIDWHGKQIARELALSGALAHPNDPELAKMARILAPARYVGSGPADPTIGLNMKWLRAHAHEHRGQWVAVRKGRLVAEADTLARSMQYVTDRQNILVTRL
jgi:hypothetical protein